MINVIHIRDAKPGDIYCGRKSSFPTSMGLVDFSILGNPYPITKKRTREETIEMYRNHITARLSTYSSVFRTLKEWSERGDINLVCFCAPLACHCDVIKSIIEEME